MKCKSCGQRETIGKFYMNDGKIMSLCEVCSIGFRPYSLRRKLAKYLAVIDAVAIILFVVLAVTNLLDGGVVG